MCIVQFKEAQIIKRVFSLLLIFSLLSVLPCNLSAFDSKRKGFVLGFGAGPGFTSYSSDYYPYSKSTLGMVTDFKIGLGVSDRLLILYSNKVVWFSFQDPVWGSSQTTLTGITSVGLSYFFKPTAPCFFISGGIGGSFWTPFQTTYFSGSWIGSGFYCGVGYESSPHFYIEISGILGSGGSNQTDYAGKNPSSIMITLNFLLY